jgi:hypothetical protein
LRAIVLGGWIAEWGVPINDTDRRSNLLLSLKNVFFSFVFVFLFGFGFCLGLGLAPRSGRQFS